MAKELIVAGFAGAQRAAEVLSQLHRVRDASTIDLEDAVAAYRTDDGRLRIDQSAHPARSQGDWNVLLAGLLASLAPAQRPPASNAAAAGAADAQAWKAAYGISDDFIRNLAALVKPGDSAVFALIRNASAETIAEKLRGEGAKILRAALAPHRGDPGQPNLESEQPL